MNESSWVSIFSDYSKGGYRTGGYRKNAFGDARQVQRCVWGTCSGVLYIRLYYIKAFGYVSKPALTRIGYVSMRACVAFGSGSQRLPPPPRNPPYDYSSFACSYVFCAYGWSLLLVEDWFGLLYLWWNSFWSFLLVVGNRVGLFASLKTLTSLNKESRPFFLGDNSIWSLPSVSPLSDYSIWRS